MVAIFGPLPWLATIVTRPAAVRLKAANVQQKFFELDSYHQIISQEFIQSSVTCPNKKKTRHNYLKVLHSISVRLFMIFSAEPKMILWDYWCRVPPEGLDGPNKNPKRHHVTPRVPSRQSSRNMELIAADKLRKTKTSEMSSKCRHLARHFIRAD